MNMGDNRRENLNLEQLKELMENSTDVVNWYAYSEFSGATVRGPWGRWFRVDDIVGPTKVHVASALDDAKYAAAAMNNLPKLIDELEQFRKTFDELQDMIESVDAYDGREALDMLDRVYGFVRSYTGRQSIAERRPELVGLVSGGGNRKEDLE